MAARLHALVIRTPDPERLSAFWDGLLADSEVPFLLAFEPSDQPRAGLNQIHFHLTSNSSSQDATVARALELGASHLDVGQLPDEDHVVLADPDGNEFCVIEAGNSWLAGMGFLGELAADGTREVGVFWAAALDWPLVWDEDGETAIQPPEGGIKIAWGGLRSTSTSARTGCTSSWSPTTSIRRSSGWSGWGRGRSRGTTTGSRWRIRTGTSSGCRR